MAVLDIGAGIHLCCGYDLPRVCVLWVCIYDQERAFCQLRLVGVDSSHTADLLSASELSGDRTSTNILPS